MTLPCLRLRCWTDYLEQCVARCWRRFWVGCGEPQNPVWSSNTQKKCWLHSRSVLPQTWFLGSRSVCPLSVGSRLAKVSKSWVYYPIFQTNYLEGLGTWYEDSTLQCGYWWTKSCWQSLSIRGISCGGWLNLHDCTDGFKQLTVVGWRKSCWSWEWNPSNHRDWMVEWSTNLLCPIPGEMILDSLRQGYGILRKTLQTRYFSLRIKLACIYIYIYVWIWLWNTFGPQTQTSKMHIRIPKCISQNA